MRNGLILIILGLGLAGASVSINASQRAGLDALRSTVAELQARVSVAQDALRAATTTADSAAARRVVAERTYWLGRRAYHVPPLEARVATWWTLTGPGTLLVLLGVVLSIAGGWRLARSASAR